MKVCKTCGIEKPFSEYHVARKVGGMSGGYSAKNVVYKSHCKECYRTRQREKWSQLSIEKRRERKNNNKCSTPEWHREYKLKTKYGLTTEDFSSMILEQNSCCKICNQHMDNPQVDHCHTTGKVRGLLCRACNTSLGLLKENPETLRNMISYINDSISKNPLEKSTFDR
jgi:hypothetical protein